MPLPLTISEEKKQSKKCIMTTNPRITDIYHYQKNKEGQFHLIGPQTELRNSIRACCAQESQGEEDQRQRSPVQGAALQSPCRQDQTV